MIRTAFVVAATAMLLAAPAGAANCRNGKGQFVKCPAKAAAKVAKCRDANGHFAKCGTVRAKAM